MKKTIIVLLSVLTIALMTVTPAILAWEGDPPPFTYMHRETILKIAEEMVYSNWSPHRDFKTVAAPAPYTSRNLYNLL